MNHSNMEFDAAAPAGVPLRVGDYHYAQDRIRDFWHLKKWIARMVRIFINSTTGLLSGGTVTAGATPATQVSIAAGSAASLFSVQKPGAAWGTPPATLMEDVEHVFDFSALADQAVNAGGVWNATLDGSTPNYLKVAYAETDGPTRARAKAVGNYAYERVPSYVFSCSPVAPTDYEALLATITGDGATALVIVPKRPLLNSRLTTLVQSSQILVPDSLHIVDGTPYQGTYSLSLPEADVGSVIDLEIRAACKIVQSDAEHVMSWFQSLFTTKGTTGLVCLFPGDRARLTYRGAGFCLQAPVKLANPATLPASGGYVSWSPDGRYLAVGHATTPFVTIYDWISGAPVKVTNPATLPANNGYGVSWSPDGRYLAVAHVTTPFVTIYDWISGAPVKVTNPATLPANYGRGVSWSPDGRYLAVAHDTTPFITIYDWISGAPVKVTNPATLPASSGYGVSWSPDGRYLAVGHDTSPYVTIYDWISGAPVKITNPATLPVGTGLGVSWSPDGRYLVVGHATTPFITIYDWISGAPVKVTNPATLPASSGYGVSWSPDGRYLAVAHDASPYVTIYDWISGAPVKITNPATLPVGTGLGVSWSPDGRYLVVGHATTPFITIYDNRLAAAKEWMIDIASRGLERIGFRSILGYRFK